MPRVSARDPVAQVRRAVADGRHPPPQVEVRSAKLGVTFRRQVPLRGYIVDFYASKAKLIVEVDGGYHGRRVAQDAARDAVLVAAGFRVVRVSEELVVRRRAEAVARVRRSFAP